MMHDIGKLTIALGVLCTTLFFYSAAISTVQAHDMSISSYEVASLVNVCQVRHCV
jgi:hypothetical protein